MAEPQKEKPAKTPVSYQDLFSEQPVTKVPYQELFPTMTPEEKAKADEWEELPEIRKLGRKIKAGWLSNMAGIENTLAELLPVIRPLPTSPLSPYNTFVASQYMKQKAVETLERRGEINAPTGDWTDIGTMVPLMAGITASALLSPVTGGGSLSFIPTLIGEGTMIGLTASVYGNSLLEQEEYEKATGRQIPEFTKQSVAILSAAAMLVAGKVVGSGSKAINKSLGDAISTSMKESPELATNVMRRYISETPGAMEKLLKLGKMTSAEALKSGTTFGAMTLGQDLVSNIYKYPEDRLRFEELITNAANSFLGGAFFGALLGPVQMGQSELYNYFRRKKSGINVVQTKDGQVYERIGDHPTDRNKVMVMDRKMNFKDINRDDIIDGFSMTTAEKDLYLDAYKTNQDAMPGIEEAIKRNAVKRQSEELTNKLIFNDIPGRKPGIGPQKEVGANVLVYEVGGQKFFIKNISGDGKLAEGIKVVPRGDGTYELQRFMLKDFDIGKTTMVPAQSYSQMLLDYYTNFVDSQPKQEYDPVSHEPIDPLTRQKNQDAANKATKVGAEVKYMGRNWEVQEITFTGSVKVQEIKDNGEFGEIMEIPPEKVSEIGKDVKEPEMETVTVDGREVASTQGPPAYYENDKPKSKAYIRGLIRTAKSPQALAGIRWENDPELDKLFKAKFPDAVRTYMIGKDEVERDEVEGAITAATDPADLKDIKITLDPEMQTRLDAKIAELTPVTPAVTPTQEVTKKVRTPEQVIVEGMTEQEYVEGELSKLAPTATEEIRKVRTKEIKAKYQQMKRTVEKPPEKPEVPKAKAVTPEAPMPQKAAPEEKKPETINVKQKGAEAYLDELRRSKTGEMEVTFPEEVAKDITERTGIKVIADTEKGTIRLAKEEPEIKESADQAMTRIATEEALDRLKAGKQTANKIQKDVEWLKTHFDSLPNNSKAVARKWLDEHGFGEKPEEKLTKKEIIERHRDEFLKSRGLKLSEIYLLPREKQMELSDEWGKKLIEDGIIRDLSEVAEAVRPIVEPTVSVEGVSKQAKPIVELGERKPTPAGLIKRLKITEETFTVPIIRAGEEVGSVTIENRPEGWRIKWIDVYQARKTGSGREAIRLLNEQAGKEGKVIISDVKEGGRTSEAMQRAWAKLVESGEAEQMPDGTWRMKAEKELQPQLLEGVDEVQKIIKILHTMPVYHGTFGEFRNFDPEKLGTATGAASAKEGFFFATNPQVAASYASKVRQKIDALQNDADKATDELFELTEASRIQAGFSLARGEYDKEKAEKVKALLARIDAYEDYAAGLEEFPMAYEEEEPVAEGAEVKKVYLDIKNPLIKNYHSTDFRDEPYVKVIRDAKAKGHDSVIFKNTYDGGEPVGHMYLTDVIVVFDPSQISNAPITVIEGGQKTAGEINGEVTEARKEVEPEPTEAEKEAGNYPKGHLDILGMKISIETAKGGIRSGMDPSGKKWSIGMKNDYGHILGTESADGDLLDVFIGKIEPDQKVYVIDQIKPETGEFDEIKVMLGFNSDFDARAGYIQNYEPGWRGLGEINEIDIEDFKNYAFSKRTKKPFFRNLDAWKKVGDKYFNKTVLSELETAKKSKEYVERKAEKPVPPVSPEKVEIEEHPVPGGRETGVGGVAPEGEGKPEFAGERVKYAPFATWRTNLQAARDYALHLFTKEELSDLRSDGTVDWYKTDSIVKAIDSKLAGQPTVPEVKPEEPPERQVKLIGEYKIPEEYYRTHEYPQKGLEPILKREIGRFSKDMAGILGWEHETDKKGKPVYSHINLPPAGGEGSFTLWKPDSDIGVYVRIPFIPDPSDQGEYTEKWIIRGMQDEMYGPILWRMLRKEGDKVRHMDNQWVGKDITTWELAQLVKKQITSLEKPKKPEFAGETFVKPPDWENFIKDMAGVPGLNGAAARTIDLYLYQRKMDDPQNFRIQLLGDVNAAITDYFYKHLEQLRKDYGPVEPTADVFEKVTDIIQKQFMPEYKTLGEIRKEVDIENVNRLFEGGRKGILKDEAESAAETWARYIKQFAKVQEKPAEPAEKPVRDKLISGILAKISAGERIANTPQLVKMAEEAGMKIGVDYRDIKELYDIASLSLNKHIMAQGDSYNPVGKTPEQVTQIVQDLIELQDLLPTETQKSEEQVKLQQYSTPPALAFLVNWVAEVNGSDISLEPSAGEGNIAIYSKLAGAKVIANEYDPNRLELLKTLGFDKVTKEDAKFLHAVGTLQGDKVTVVVMNPPFSRDIVLGNKLDIHAAEKHIDSALQKLEPNGRLVAIVGKGMSFDSPTHNDWWAKIKSKYKVRANVLISGDAYAKKGTSFDNRIIVIDKVGETVSSDRILTNYAENYTDLTELLQAVPKRLFKFEKEVENEPIAQYSEEENAATPRRGEPGTSGYTSTDVGGVQRGDTGQSGPEHVRPAGVGGRGNAPATVQRRGGTGEVGPIEQKPVGPAVSGLGTGKYPPTGKKGTGGRTTLQRHEGELGGLPEQTPVGTGREIPGRGISVIRLPKRKAQNLSDKGYDVYSPEITIKGAKDHPTPLVESSAMASVPLPETNYVPALPQSVVDSGALSSAQLEDIILAGNAHRQVLPSGNRRGFFLGAGTGYGKGRAIAGILLDNLNRGSEKGVWISVNTKSHRDSPDYWKAVGGDGKYLLKNPKANTPIRASKGILLTTYGTLRSQFNPKIRRTEEDWERYFTEPSKNRVQQIAQWLGRDFNGVIVFDESHMMGNAVSTRGTRGRKKPSNQALAGLELQKMLPDAKIVYSSATGATEVSNLTYAQRLGLWGDGTAFGSAEDFITAVETSGVAGMELISKDLKGMGLYTAKQLSFDGVEYDSIKHILAPEQVKLYDKVADAWQIVLKNINKALEDNNSSKNAKSAALSAFWGAHQRFFGQIITTMETPTMIEDIQRELDAGNSVVIQLVTTNEAQLNRSLADLRLEAEEEVDLAELDLSPKMILIDLLFKSFPVQMYEDAIDENGNMVQVPVVDSEGNPVLNPESVAARDKLISDIREELTLPEAPIDIIINTFGVDNVAEVTGRSHRVVLKLNKEQQLTKQEESRTDANVKKDTNDFMDGKKRILLFSKAGGTGSSFHSDLTRKNQQRRIAYVLQAGWQADAAIQGFGRSHRSNQKVAPKFKLVTTNLKSQMRFLSSIAKRLEQLGALTKGQRDTGGGGVLDGSYNLEDRYARQALFQFYQDVEHGQVPGVDMKVLEDQMALKIYIERDGVRTYNDDVVFNTKTFLNRLMSLRVALMDSVFEGFIQRLNDGIEAAKLSGTYDAGIESVKAEKIRVTNEQEIYTDEVTNAKSYLTTFELDLKNIKRNWDEINFAVQRYADKFIGFYKEVNSGKVYAMVEQRIMDADGTSETRIKRMSVVADVHISYWDLREKYTKLKQDEAKMLWDTDFREYPETRKRNETIVKGLVLPIWNRLPDRINVKRYIDDEGQAHLGRYFPPNEINRIVEQFEVANTQRYSAKQIKQIVKDRGLVRLSNGFELVSAKYQSLPVIKVNNAISYRDKDRLERAGAIYAVTSSLTMRGDFFIPMERAIDAIDEIEKLFGISVVYAEDSEGNFVSAAPEEPAFIRRPRVLDEAELRSQIAEAENKIVLLNKQKVEKVNAAKGLVTGQGLFAGDKINSQEQKRTIARITEDFDNQIAGAEAELTVLKKQLITATKENRGQLPIWDNPDYPKYKFENAGWAGDQLDLMFEHEMLRRAIIMSRYTGVPIVVVRSKYDLPERIQNSIRKTFGKIEDSGIPALYDKETGTVYAVIEDTRTISDFVSNMSHEIFAHHGLVALLGKDRYRDVLRLVYRGMLPSDIIDIANTYNTNVYDWETIAQEFLGNMAGDNKINPTLWQKIIAKIREWIRRIFNISMSKAEIINLLRRSKENLTKNKPKPEDYTNIGDYLAAMTAYTAKPVRTENKFGYGIHVGESKILTETIDSENLDYRTYFKVAESRIGERAAEWIEMALVESNFNEDDALDFLAERMEKYSGNEKYYNMIEAAHDYFLASPPKRPEGIYQVLVGKGKSPQELNFIYWDKPVEDSTFEDVLNQLDVEGKPLFLLHRNIQSGAELYKKITEIYGSPREASLFLSRSGVDGMIYNEQLQGPAAPYDTRKYVIFDNTPVDVLNQIAFKRSKKPAFVGEHLARGGAAYLAPEKTKRNWEETIQGMREYLQDMNLPVRKFEEEVLRRGGLQPNEAKPYRDISLSFGRQETLYKAYIRNQMKPVMETVAKIIRAGMPGEDVLPYIISKHGIERNVFMREREMLEFIERLKGKGIIPESDEGKQKINAYLEKITDKDYSGVMMFDSKNGVPLGNFVNPEELARTIVDEFEAVVPKVLIEELWKNMRNASSQILEYWEQGIQISPEDKQMYLDRFQYFVPLRGWREGAAKELMYTKGRGFSKSFMHAKGRKSLADNPLVHMQNVAFQAIGELVDNEIKTSMLNLLMKNLANADLYDLATVKKLYYIRHDLADGTYEYEPTIDRPPQELWDEPGRVTTKIYREHYKLRSPGESREHEVYVRRTNGDVAMIFKGKMLPVAQALNKRNFMYHNIFGHVKDARIMNRASTTLSYVNNFLKATYTSWNIVFPFTNFMRDFQEASITQLIKGENGPGVIKNYSRSFPTILRFMLGKLDMNLPDDVEYNNFITAGGPTGFTHLLSAEDLEKQLMGEINRMIGRGTVRGEIKEYTSEAIKIISMWNQMFEDATRFSVYLTSRGLGKTIEEAAYDAKEASINFNRKGKSSKSYDALYAFWNVAWQSVQKNFKLAKDFTKAFVSVAVSFMALGFLEALLNKITDDEDPENDYYNINPWMRENYLILPNIPRLIRGESKGNKYLSIPLPQFWRGFKSVGSLLFDVTQGQIKPGEAVAKAMLNFGASLSPVDPGGFGRNGEFSLAPLIPTVGKPFYEIMTNRNYMGYTIAREPFDKAQEKLLAQARLGKDNVNPAAKFLTDILFRWGGGDNATKYYMSKTGEEKKVPFFLNINPSYIEHLFKGYTGGTGAVFSDMITTISQALKPDEEVNFKNVPFVNRFLRQTPEAKWNIIADYYNLKDVVARHKALKREYLKQAEAGEGAEKIAATEGAGYYEEYQGILDAYDKDISEISDQVDFNDIEGTKPVYDLMQQCINDIKALKKKFNMK